MTDIIMTESAQITAKRWLDAGIERSEQLSQRVSGEGEQAEILTTIRAMITTRDIEIERLQDKVMELTRDNDFLRTEVELLQEMRHRNE